MTGSHRAAVTVNEREDFGGLQATVTQRFRIAEWPYGDHRPKKPALASFWNNQNR
jgi:hypothetical protein